MKTPLVSVVMFAVAAVLGALGQFLYKTGAERIGRPGESLVNWRIVTGIVCYVAVMGLFVGAFKRGGELTVLYPVYASTFIWAALIAFAAYDTPIKPVNWLGMGLLIGGMYLMGK